METRLLQSDAELLARREAWNELLRHSAADNVFLTHEWVSAWRETFPDEGRLAVVWAEENGVPVGIAPLYVETKAFWAGIPATQLFFLGNRWVGGDFLDFILAAGREREVLGAVIEFLVKTLGWDRLILDDVDSASPSLPLLRDAAAERGLALFTRPRYRCPWMELPETWDAFMELPDKIFKRIVQREGVKKLWKRHQVDLVMPCPAPDVDAALDVLFDLSLQRWREQGIVGCFEDARVRDFYRRASRALAARDWLRLSLLKVDGTPRVAEYAMEYGGRYYSLQGGCDAEGLRLRAGHVLQYKIFESLVGRVRAFHFLRGEEQYKYQWGCADRHTVQLILARTPKGSLMSVARICQDRAKKIAKRVLRRGTR
jgi:CelD/BcsL family acetyltransferase involved in cellulose biosynthesis